MQYVLDGYELIWEGPMPPNRSKKVPPHLFGWQPWLTAGRQGTIIMTRSKSIGKNYLLSSIRELSCDILGLRMCHCQFSNYRSPIGVFGQRYRIGVNNA